MGNQVIDRLVMLAKRHSLLKYPVLVILLLGWGIQSIGEKFRLPLRRMTAGLLSACMTLTVMPVTTYAKEGGTPDSVVILSFEELADDVKYQTVPYGTEEHALVLPSTLKVLVSDEEQEPDWETATLSEAYEKKESVSPKTARITGVNWECDENYDKYTWGGGILSLHLYCRNRGQLDLMQNCQ